MRLTAISAALFAIVLAFAISSTSVQAATITKTSNIKIKKQIKQVKTAPVVTPPQQTIVVSQGDSLSQIATAHNTTMLRMFYANTAIVDPNLIYPGEVLVIPSPNESLTPRQLPSDQAPATTTSGSSTAAQATTTAQTTAVNPSTQSGSVWGLLANCESGGNWSINTGNGFYGGLQFTLSSWQAAGGVGYPNQATQAQQIAIAEVLQSKQGWGAWPVCSQKLGL
jgi:hypothetical protein